MNESVNSTCGLLRVRLAKLEIAITSPAAGIGAASCVLAIFLIIASKVYRSYTHRINLYLTIAALCRTVVIGLQVLPIDINQPSNATVRVKSGWGVPCAAIGFLTEYLFQSESLIRIWICSYVFGFAFFRFQFNRTRCELTGLLIVLILPALTTWIPFIDNSYGLTGTNCWVITKCNGRHFEGYLYLILIEDSLYSTLLIISSVMVAAVVISFCRGAFKQGSTLQECHRAAVKAIIPLLVYPIVEICVTVIKGVKNIYYTSVISTADDEETKFVSGTLVVLLYLITPLSLPAALVLYSDVRSGLCKKKRSTKIASSYGGTVHSTSDHPPLVSSTYFIVSKESTDTAQLIIK